MTKNEEERKSKIEKIQSLYYTLFDELEHPYLFDHYEKAKEKLDESFMWFEKESGFVKTDMKYNTYKKDIK